MKKILKYLLCLSIFMMYGCTNEVDVTKLYDDAYINTHDIDEIEYNMNVNVKFDTLEGDNTLTLYEVPFDIKAQIKGIKDKNIEYHTNIVTSYNNETISQKEWFKDGKAYIDDGYDKYVTELDNESAFNLYSSLKLPKLNNFEVINSAKNNNSTTLEIKTSKDEMISNLNQMDILKITGLDLASLKEYTENIEISNIELSISDDGYVVEEKFALSLIENDSKMSITIEIKLSNFNNVNIDTFDTTEFKEITNVEIEKDITIDEATILLNDFDFIEYGDGILAKEINGEIRFIDLISKMYYTNEVCYDWEYNYGYDINYSCVYDFNNNTSEGECDNLLQTMNQLKNEYDNLYKELSLIIDSMKQ